MSEQAATLPPKAMADGGVTVTKDGNTTVFKRASSSRGLADIANNLLDNDMSEAKPPISVFQLPCGVVTEDGNLHTEIEVSEIDGELEDLLANPKVQTDTKMDRMMLHCTKRIGPFVDPTVLRQLPDELTVGDRIFLTYAIRRASVGEFFPVIAKCPSQKEPKCGKDSLQRFDLSTLEIKKMPDPRVREFEEKSPSGLMVGWHVMCGADEHRLRSPGFMLAMRDLKLDEEAVLATRNIYARVHSLSGKPVDLTMLRKLSMRDRNWIRERFEEVEGGVNTDYDMECPHCRHTWKTPVDVGAQGFFSPSRVLKEWKKRSST